VGRASRRGRARTLSRVVGLEVGEDGSGGEGEGGGGGFGEVGAEQVELGEGVPSRGISRLGPGRVTRARDCQNFEPIWLPHWPTWM
jgi:hypothetical protein